MGEGDKKLPNACHSTQTRAELRYSDLLGQPSLRRAMVLEQVGVRSPLVHAASLTCLPPQECDVLAQLMATMLRPFVALVRHLAARKARRRHARAQGRPHN